MKLILSRRIYNYISVVSYETWRDVMLQHSLKSQDSQHYYWMKFTQVSRNRERISHEFHPIIKNVLNIVCHCVAKTSNLDSRFAAGDNALQFDLAFCFVLISYVFFYPVNKQNNYWKVILSHSNNYFRKLILVFGFYRTLKWCKWFELPCIHRWLAASLL